MSVFVYKCWFKSAHVWAAEENHWARIAEGPPLEHVALSSLMSKAPDEATFDGSLTVAHRTLALQVDT